MNTRPPTTREAHWKTIDRAIDRLWARFPRSPGSRIHDPGKWRSAVRALSSRLHDAHDRRIAAHIPRSLAADYLAMYEIWRKTGEIDALHRLLESPTAKAVCRAFPDGSSYAGKMAIVCRIAAH